MRLYNTLTRKIERIPHQNSIIRIYLCGVTVYDKSHIGHARTIVVIDLLNRLLRDSGFRVKFLKNFTDVDYKIIKIFLSVSYDISKHMNLSGRFSVLNQLSLIILRYCDRS